MNRIVLDSSAVLALLNDEPGGNAVRAILADAVMCTVNVAEVITRLVHSGENIEEARQLIAILDLDMVDFDYALAEKTGALASETRKSGLSLGDRACLAVAVRDSLPVMTADRSWRAVDIGVKIEFIR